jgi:hypothetical protein
MRDHGPVNSDEYLVAYDYGMGGLWAVLIAPSRDDIAAKYPELNVVDEVPHWMDEERLAQLRADALFLDEEIPSGMLKAVVADRDRP